MCSIVFLKAKCGGTIYDRSGQILSPNYPSAYDANMHCVWRLRASDNFHFNLNFKSFNLGPTFNSPECDKRDRLNITDMDKRDQIKGILYLILKNI